MTENPRPFTHTAFLFIRTAVRKGRVYGYWKDGGRFRLDGDGGPFAFIDMLPRGGWDGRIRFVKIGDPPPEKELKAPLRPDDPSGGDAADEEASED